MILLIMQSKPLVTHLLLLSAPHKDPGSVMLNLKIFRGRMGNQMESSMKRPYYVGNPWPKFTYNFNSSLSYKGFDLNLFFTGVNGNDILNQTRYQNESPLGGPYTNRLISAANFAVPSSVNIADALTVKLLNPGTTIYRPSSANSNGTTKLLNGRLKRTDPILN